MSKSFSRIGGTSKNYSQQYNGNVMQANNVNGMGINYLLAERKQSDRRRIDAAMTSIKP